MVLFFDVTNRLDVFEFLVIYLTMGNLFSNLFYAFELKYIKIVTAETVVKGLLTNIYHRLSRTRTVVSTP